MEATFPTARIAKLILCEPPVRDPVERNLTVAGVFERLIQAAEREHAVVTLQSEVGGQSPREIAAMKTRPSGPALVATIDSQPRQLRALAAYRFGAARLSAVSMPTLLLIGGETTSPYLKRAIGSLEAALPDVTVLVLEGQQHNAMDAARQALADAIITFATGSSGEGQ